MEKLNLFFHRIFKKYLSKLPFRPKLFFINLFIILFILSVGVLYLKINSLISRQKKIFFNNIAKQTDLLISYDDLKYKFLSSINGKGFVLQNDSLLFDIPELQFNINLFVFLKTWQIINAVSSIEIMDPEIHLLSPVNDLKLKQVKTNTVNFIKKLFNEINEININIHNLTLIQNDKKYVFNHLITEIKSSEAARLSFKCTYTLPGGELKLNSTLSRPQGDFEGKVSLIKENSIIDSYTIKGGTNTHDLYRINLESENKKLFCVLNYNFYSNRWNIHYQHKDLPLSYIYLIKDLIYAPRSPGLKLDLEKLLISRSGIGVFNPNALSFSDIRLASTNLDKANYDINYNYHLKIDYPKSGEKFNFKIGNDKGGQIYYKRGGSYFLANFILKTGGFLPDSSFVFKNLKVGEFSLNGEGNLTQHLSGANLVLNDFTINQYPKPINLILLQSNDTIFVKTKGQSGIYIKVAIKKSTFEILKSEIKFNNHKLEYIGVAFNNDMIKKSVLKGQVLYYSAENKGILSGVFELSDKILGNKFFSGRLAYQNKVLLINNGFMVINKGISRFNFRFNAHKHKNALRLTYSYKDNLGTVYGDIDKNKEMVQLSLKGRGWNKFISTWERAKNRLNVTADGTWGALSLKAQLDRGDLKKTKITGSFILQNINPYDPKSRISSYFSNQEGDFFLYRSGYSDSYRTLNGFGTIKYNNNFIYSINFKNKNTKEEIKITGKNDGLDTKANISLNQIEINKLNYPYKLNLNGRLRSFIILTGKLYKPNLLIKAYLSAYRLNGRYYTLFLDSSKIGDRIDITRYEMLQEFGLNKKEKRENRVIGKKSKY